MKQEKKKLTFEVIWQKWKEHHIIKYALFLLLGIVLYVSLISNIAPEVIDISLASRAERDIYSPITIVDPEATERAKVQAERDIESVYYKDDSITNSQIRKLDSTFSKVKEIVSTEEIGREQKLSKLGEVIVPKLEEDHLSVFIDYPLEDIETLRRITTSVVHEIMDSGVNQKSNGLQLALQRVDDSLMLSTLDTRLKTVSREMARGSIVPNFVINAEETSRLRQEARDNVPNVLIREGDLLIAAGEVVSYDAFRKIKLVGLHEETANMRPYIALAIFVLIIILFIGYYIAYSDLNIQKNNTTLLMYVVIFLICILFMKIMNFFQHLDYSGIAYLTPIACGTMLVTMLIHQRLAIFTSFIFGIIGAIMLNGTVSGSFDYQYGLVLTISSAAGAFFLGKATRKTKILQAGFVVAFISMIAVLMISLFSQVPLGWLELGQLLSFGFLSGIFAAILTIGLMPFFEAAFRILSPMKLIELSNPNQPLLRKLLIEAPGTYHHSVMVANLAEAGAEAIGANGLLARVASYYHDVGKTKRPHFFIENQMNMENPHDKIAPHLSKTIITAHGKDGAQMLKEHKLPKPIQDVAEQHHGTTLLKYFYHKAKEDSESEVRESDFRYPGPKAQFKESAIIGIADSIEAAVRSLSKPSPERIENLVRSIIQDRLEDGQFNECDLTLKELDLIAKAICETLQGIFHSRIEYPEDKEKGKNSGTYYAKSKDKEAL